MNKNPLRTLMISVFFCSTILLNSSKVLAENNNWQRYYPDYKVGYYLNDINMDKIINITFSKSLDKETISARNIEIMDQEFKNEITADFAFLGDKKIEIKPREKLKNGQTYYMMIHDGIKASDGKKIQHGTIVVLNVKGQAIKEDNKNETNKIDFNKEEFNLIGESSNKINFIKSVIPGALDGYKKYKIFSSITLAQSILESGWGTSDKALKCNNLFGIKAKDEWAGPYLELPTKEWQDGKFIEIMDKWRVYPNINNSIEDHGRHIVITSCYEKNGVFDAENYRQQAVALSKAGYATDPEYAEKLCYVIEHYNLWKLDPKGRLVIDENNKNLNNDLKKDKTN